MRKLSLLRRNRKIREVIKSKKVIGLSACSLAVARVQPPPFGAAAFAEFSVELASKLSFSIFSLLTSEIEGASAPMIWTSSNERL